MADQIVDPTAAINHLAGTWTNYVQQAANRQIRWDPKVSLACATAVMGAVQQVVNLRAQGPLHVAPTAFGVLPSGTGADFSAAVNTLGDQFDQVLGTFTGILTDMMNTFVMAGKQYMNNDAASAQMFQNIVIPSIPVATGTKGSGPIPLDGLTNDGRTTRPYVAPGENSNLYADPSRYPSGAPQPPYLYGPLGVPANPLSVGGMAWKPMSLARLDNPAALGWTDFHTLGQTIDAASVESTAEKWSWLGQQLSDAGQALFSGIQSATTGWTGAGHDAAFGAAAYLTGQMINVGGNAQFTATDLGYASAWLASTRKAMPQNATPPSGPSWDPFAGDPADPYRTAYSNLYVFGITESNDNITGVPTPKPDTGYQVPRYNGKGPQGPTPAPPQPTPPPTPAHPTRGPAHAI